jgi:quercetin 2,3-dioxygenase
VNKASLGIHTGPQGHWVGDGFPVRSLFDYNRFGAAVSPFLLLDYAAPTQFAPTVRPRGVGEHPHRGFETVTIVYQGEVAHRDSVGNGGVIGSGDVQWMTAAGGILHEEFHSPAFTRNGGTLEMAQLWVNLPAARKMSPARYQSLSSENIPRAVFEDGAGSVRVIAGTHDRLSGPADTSSELNVWDLRLTGGKTVALPVPDGHATSVAVLRGSVIANGSRVANAAELIILDRQGDQVVIEAQNDATLLLLSGVPIDEPIVGYGPFVMNSRQEIETAMNDFRLGRFGRMPSTDVNAAIA